MIAYQLKCQSLYNDYKSESKTPAYLDEFDDNHNQWEDQSKEFTINIKNGCLNFKVFENGGKTKIRTITFFIDEKKDFELETSAKIVSDQNPIQLCWGYDNASYYSFILSPNGSFQISKYDKSRPSGNRYVDYTSYIKSNFIDNKNFNKITVRKVESQYYFFINENFILNLPFQSFFGNNLGFVVEENVSAEFDYLKVQYLNSKQTINIKNDNNNAVKNSKANSDVDINIPETKINNQNTYCLIIGNEDYSTYQTGLNSEINVDFAMNDAKIFKEYCNKTLGIPDKQVKLIINATTGQMNQGITWLCNLAKIENGNAKIIFYYSGHGLPEEQTKEAFLIPVDISGTDVKLGIKLSNLYKSLTEFPSKKVTVFLDACFSGGARNQSLISMKGVKIKPKNEIITGNLIIFSSSTGDQSSGVYREKQHGFMTYFLLKKLQEKNGDVNYGSLKEYLIYNVQKETGLDGKIQTPQVIISPQIEENWETYNMLK
ncbi:MAG: hypothetical protein A2309_12630 [Bacteroidetes bacterium RIFOXYB2_FULL_35_7]|nr:MAG: hypothetical protein A2X01_16850 [Bacteroidetes bacterium GWF2_35_48]OFY93539.1 MAG: hypothetical protein A2309_12630 [Bacteroidetes bacterium RIFOXYB2_FULL_35_7]OFY97796.1 MAG: hypothetical protein A2491_03230 [Bacteroidetes bacterium RIFOXYC12_FULL_35_7]